MIINLWVSTNRAPRIWLWVVMGLLIDFGRGFEAEFQWWIMVAVGVVVWWWLGVAWALISVEDRDGSFMGIGVAWRIKWVFVLFVGEDRVGLWWRS